MSLPHPVIDLLRDRYRILRQIDVYLLTGEFPFSERRRLLSDFETETRDRIVDLLDPPLTARYAALMGRRRTR